MRGDVVADELGPAAEYALHPEVDSHRGWRSTRPMACSRGSGSRSSGRAPDDVVVVRRRGGSRRRAAACPGWPRRAGGGASQVEPLGRARDALGPPASRPCGSRRPVTSPGPSDWLVTVTCPSATRNRSRSALRHVGGDRGGHQHLLAPATSSAGWCAAPRELGEDVVEHEDGSSPSARRRSRRPGAGRARDHDLAVRGVLHRAAGSPGRPGPARQLVAVGLDDDAAVELVLGARRSRRGSRSGAARWSGRRAARASTPWWDVFEARRWSFLAPRRPSQVDARRYLQVASSRLAPGATAS